MTASELNTNNDHGASPTVRPAADEQSTLLHWILYSECMSRRAVAVMCSTMKRTSSRHPASVDAACRQRSSRSIELQTQRGKTQINKFVEQNVMLAVEVTKRKCILDYWVEHSYAYLFKYLYLYNFIYFNSFEQLRICVSN